MKLTRAHIRSIIREEVVEMSGLYKRQPGAGIVVVRQFEDGWRVLCLHTEDFMDLPKGGIDPGEDEITTALRETSEEAHITDLHFEWGFEAMQISHVTMFVASTTQDPKVLPNPTTGELEHLGSSWLTWEEAHTSIKPWLSPCIPWARKKINDSNSNLGI